MRNEARVGAVVVTALTLMVVGYFYLRNLGLNTDRYYMRLAGAIPIAAGNDVRLQGIKIGQVQDVSLDPQTQKPLLTLVVRRGNPPYQLLRSYHYAVLASSLLGENYVDIRGDAKPDKGAYAPNDPGQVIVGAAPGGLTDITSQIQPAVQSLNTTLDKFNKTLDLINSGLLSPGNQKSLTEALNNVSLLARHASQGFGPNGIKVAFGDPRSQEALNLTLSRAATAAGEADVAARNISVLTREAGGSLNSLTRQANGLIGENRGTLRVLMASLTNAANSVSGLTRNLGSTLNSADFGKNANLTLTALRHAAENAEAATAGFKTLGTDPNTVKNLQESLAALRDTANSLKQTALTIQNAVGDPATQTQLKGILTTLNTTLTTINSTAATFQATATTFGNTAAAFQTTANNLNQTTAGLNNVVGDPKVQASLKNSATELEGTLSAARGAAERLNSILGGRRHRNSASKGGGQNAQQQGYAPGGFDFTYRYLDKGSGDRAGHSFGDVDFNAELLGGPFRIGLDNIGEGNNLTLQTGSFLGKNGAVRYGLYRSKLGAGVDYHLGRFSLEGNLWDPNHGSYNAYAGFRLSPSVEILAGRESRHGVHSNALGVRLTP